MGSVRVAIVGVGNCATSLIQGVHYYRDADPSGAVPGLMHVTFGDYHVSDVEFVAAFDVDDKKVGKDLAEAINSAFGSFSDFQAKFKETGVNQFGSGWAWLIHDGSGLAVTSTANQDSPVSDGQTALLGADVWEHAYYLKYQNKRPDYIDAWFNTIDWGKVSERYEAVA